MSDPKETGSKVRSSSVRVRLREEERTALQDFAAQLGQQPSRIIRRLIREAITGGPDYFDDGLRELHRMRVALTAIGTNLNQLARAANQGQALDGADVRRVINAGLVQVAGVEALYHQAVAAARGRSARALSEEARPAARAGADA